MSTYTVTLVYHAENVHGCAHLHALERSICTTACLPIDPPLSKIALIVDIILLTVKPVLSGHPRRMALNIGSTDWG